MMPILVAFAVVIALAGVEQLNQATLGVGLIACACLLGILARIAQAHAYQHPRIAQAEKHSKAKHQMTAEEMETIAAKIAQASPPHNGFRPVPGPGSPPEEVAAIMAKYHA